MPALITRLFPLWAFALAVTAFLWPALFNQQKSFVVPLLMIVMFCMGMTLQVSNFARVLRNRE
jgi:BASS family bile acid:Na+ symporter